MWALITLSINQLLRHLGVWMLLCILGAAYIALVVMPLTNWFTFTVMYQRTLHNSIILLFTLPLLFVSSANTTFTLTRSPRLGAYVGGLVVGVQWGFIDTIQAVSTFVLSSEQFEYHNILHLTVLGLLGFMLLVLTALFIWQTSPLMRCARISALGLATTVVTTLGCTVYSHMPLHLHHYIVGMYIVLVTRAECPYRALIQGVGLGVYLDGIIRYGFDGLWEP